MEVKRTFDVLWLLKEKYPREDILAHKVNGEWKKYDCAEYFQYSHYIAAALMDLGYKRGDHIATVLQSSPQWNFLDMGMSLAGIVHVPVYNNINEEEYEYIFNHSDAKAVFAGDKLLLQRIYSPVQKATNIKAVYTVEKTKDFLSFDDLLERGRSNIEKYSAQLSLLRNEIRPDDLLTIIYTSGTTGNPKGVMLTHNNIVTNLIATASIQPLVYGHKVLSFLPLCHVFERMLNYHFQYKGIGIYYAESLATIGDNLREVHPHGFTTVPRILEGIYDKLVAKGKDIGGIKKIVFFWAMRLAFRFEMNRANGWWYELKRKIADKLVYRHWRISTGGNIAVIICGGAALQTRLIRMFWASGLKIVEGYGLTETSPVISVNHYYYPDIKFGTVGPILYDVTVKIAEDGEILCKGPNVMPGYYKSPELTEEVIDSEGWFHTGDIGVFVDDRFLKITDRKKEIFKNSGGKYIAPQVIENKCKESVFIEQALVVGENEKFTAAVISPNFNYLHFWATKHKVHFRDNRDLVQKQGVITRIQREIDDINKTLSPHEQIKRFRVVGEAWSAETGELSPTLKLKRKNLYSKYENILKEMYNYAANEENRTIKDR